jgi:hypothetical protein
MIKFVFMLLCAVSMAYCSVVPSYAAPPQDDAFNASQTLSAKIVAIVEAPIQKALDSVNATNSFVAVKNGADSQSVASIDGSKLVQDIVKSVLPAVQAEINKAAENSSSPFIKWFTGIVGLMIGFVFSKASKDEDRYRAQN